MIFWEGKFPPTIQFSCCQDNSLVIPGLDNHRLVDRESHRGFVSSHRRRCPISLTIMAFDGVPGYDIYIGGFVRFPRPTALVRANDRSPLPDLGSSPLGTRLHCSGRTSRMCSPCCGCTRTSHSSIHSTISPSRSTMWKMKTSSATLPRPMPLSILGSMPGVASWFIGQSTPQLPLPIVNT